MTGWNPLAVRIRPKTLDEFVWQEHLVGNRNSSTKPMKGLGYGKGYKKYDEESYLPDKLKRRNISEFAIVVG